MADGVVHAHYARRTAKVISAIAGAAALTVNPALIGLAVGAWAGVICDPDLDHHVHTESEAIVYRYNRVLGVLWSWYWWPYEKLNPHRGRSHRIPVGTLERFVLLFWPLLILSWRWSSIIGPSVVVFWVFVFVGQCVTDATHLWHDNRL